MAADEFGGGINHDVYAVLNRLEQIRRNRVVQNDRQIVLVRDFGQFVQIGYIIFRIADALGVNGFGFIRDGGLNIFRIAGIYEFDRDAEFAQSVMKEIVSAAVEIVERNYLVAGLRQSEYRQRDSGLAGSQSQRADAAVQLGQPFLKNVGSGIHQASVNVTEFAQTKKVSRVLGVLEHIRCGLINRHRPRVRGRIDHLPAVQ